MAEKKVLSPNADTEQGRREYSKQNAALWNKLIGNCPADSTAVDVAGIVADYNALLAIIRGLTTK